MPGQDTPDDITQTNVSKPWKPARSNLKLGLREAKDLYKDGSLAPEAYSGNRVAGFGDLTQSAQSGIVDIAGGQSGYLADAANTVSNIANTDNIYRDMDAVRQSTLESVMPSVMAAFGGAGMQDSSVARQEAATAATTAIAPIEYGAWSQAQDRALQASSMVPAMMQAQYLPQQMIGQVGSAQDAMAQAGIDADMAEYYENANRDALALERFSNLSLGYGGAGGTTTSTGTSPGTGTSGFGQVAGAGLAGLGTYGALAQTPLAAPYVLGGSLLAGLGSLF